MAEQKEKGSASIPWSDSELRTSIDAYLYMLQLETAAVPFSVAEQERLLISGPLSARNEVSVRYRLRNISHVMKERGEATLSAYSAAPQVGKNVKARIHGLLDERQSTLQAIRQMVGNRGADTVELDEVLIGLHQLKEMIFSLASEANPVAGIGHNKPPENIVIGVEDISEAVRAISRIESAVSDHAPDIGTVERSSNTLVALGMKSALWAGQRLTDFSKAGAIAAGTSAGLSLTGLSGQIVEMLRKVFTYLF
ncbi:hypothetical protein [Roseovarius sp.]|uniref:hypothetical protein n=1 Tax=Roseovarius sp. TaxID=1486281 RepID=UPI003A98096C